MALSAHVPPWLVPANFLQSATAGAQIGEALAKLQLARQELAMRSMRGGGGGGPSARDTLERDKFNFEKSRIEGQDAKLNEALDVNRRATLFGGEDAVKSYQENVAPYDYEGRIGRNLGTATKLGQAEIPEADFDTQRTGVFKNFIDAWGDPIKQGSIVANNFKYFQGLTEPQINLLRPRAGRGTAQSLVLETDAFGAATKTIKVAPEDWPKIKDTLSDEVKNSPQGKALDALSGLIQSLEAKGKNNGIPAIPGLGGSAGSTNATPRRLRYNPVTGNLE